MKFLFAILLFTPALAWAGSPNTAEYTIDVHMQSSRLILRCEPMGFSPYCQHMQYIVAIIDGKKVELDSTLRTSALLKIGYYKARIVKDDPPGAYEYQREYEFLFPDGKTRQYLVVGEGE